MLSVSHGPIGTLSRAPTVQCQFPWCQPISAIENGIAELHRVFTDVEMTAGTEIRSEVSN